MISPQNTQYLFLDMNSFFASCEQQANIELRHKPIAVTPINTPNCCIVSASYEAKAYGIKTGILNKDAKMICPQIIIIEADVKKYLQYHQKLVRVLSSFSPFVIVKSVDEAVIKLTPNEQNTVAAINLAKQIKDQIRQDLGQYLKCSIGIGPNVWLSKMAAESQKPDGLVELKLTDLPQFFEKLKLTDLKGIARRMEIQLNYRGFQKPIDLYLSSAENLRRKLGICGEYWYLRMHGYDIDAPQYQSPLPKSIGQSHVLEPKYRTWVQAWSVCQKLVERAGARLRTQNLTASGVYLAVRIIGNPSWVKSYKTSPFSDSQTFLKHIGKFWQKISKKGQPLKIGVGLFNLSKPVGYQSKIFPQLQKLDNLYQAIDQINDRYGSFTIKPANLLSVENSAPVRISFGQPRQ